MPSPPRRRRPALARAAVLAGLVACAVPAHGATPDPARAAGSGASVTARVAQVWAAMSLPDSAGPVLRSAAPALAFGTLVSAATLCVCLAALAFGQRRLGARLEATLADLDYTSDQMRGAAGLSRESAATVTRLANAASDAEHLLRGWIESAQAGQEKAAALAAKCTRLADALPELMAEAMATIQARSQASIEDAAGRLDGKALEIAAAASSVQDGARRFADTAARQEAQQDEAAALVRQCEAAIAALPETVGETLVTIQARGQAAIDAAANRLAGCAGDIDLAAASLRGVARDAAQAAAGEAAARDQAAALAQQWAALTESLPETVNAAIAAACQQSLDAAQAAHLRLQDSALCIEAAAAELTSGGQAAAKAMAAQITRLDDAAARVDGVAKSLPEVTTHLAEGAAAMRREAQHGVQLLSEAQVEIARVAEDMAVAAAAAETGLDRLTHAAAAQEEASTRAAATVAALTACAGTLERRGTALCDSLADQTRRTDDGLARLDAALLPQHADRLQRAADGLEAVLTAAGAPWRNPVDEAARDGEQATLLASLAARAEAAAAAIPAETQLLVAEAACLREAAARLADQAARAMAEARASDDRAGDNAVPAGCANPGPMAGEAPQGWSATTLPDAALTGAVAGLADATTCLRAELAANSAALEAGLGRLLEAAALLRQDAALATVALDQTAATEANGHAARLEAVAQTVQARLEAACAALDHAASRDAAPSTALPALLDRLMAAIAGMEGASAGLGRLVVEPDGGRTMADLRQAASQIAQAAGRLEAAGAWQESAAERVTHAAAAAMAAASAAPHETAAPLAALDNLAAQTAALLAEASTLADSAAKGAALPAALQAQTPTLLAAIDGNIQRLRGAATALALASDAPQRAA